MCRHHPSSYAGYRGHWRDFDIRIETDLRQAKHLINRRAQLELLLRFKVHTAYKKKDYKRTVYDYKLELLDWKLLLAPPGQVKQTVASGQR